MTAQLRDLTHKLYSYTDKDGRYCEVWGSDEDFDPYDRNVFIDDYSGLDCDYMG